MAWIQFTKCAQLPQRGLVAETPLERDEGIADSASWILGSEVAQSKINLAMNPSCQSLKTLVLSSEAGAERDYGPNQRAKDDEFRIRQLGVACLVAREGEESRQQRLMVGLEQSASPLKTESCLLLLLGGGFCAWLSAAR